MNEC
jgi:hypothetical protein